MEFIIGAIRFALFLFMIVLFARVVLGLVMSFSRDWRPEGGMLVITESVFSVTDPPIKALRKVIPPLRLGAVQFDVAFLVLFLGCSFLYSFLGVVQYNL